MITEQLTTPAQEATVVHGQLVHALNAVDLVIEGGAMRRQLELEGNRLEIARQAFQSFGFRAPNAARLTHVETGESNDWLTKQIIPPLSTVCLEVSFDDRTFGYVAGGVLDREYDLSKYIIISPKTEAFNVSKTVLQIDDERQQTQTSSTLTFQEKNMFVALAQKLGNS